MDCKTDKSIECQFFPLNCTMLPVIPHSHLLESINLLSRFTVLDKRGQGFSDQLFLVKFVDVTHDSFFAQSVLAID